MNKGSKRVTVRLGKALHAIVEREVQMHNERGGGAEEMTLTDWIVSAIGEKINHAERGRKGNFRTKIVKTDEYRPRDVYDNAFWLSIKDMNESCEVNEIPKEKLTPILRADTL